MCFRPASTTIGARICLTCHYVCDDVSAAACPQCGAPFDAPDEAPAPAAGAGAPAPGAPTAPVPPKAPEGEH